jgi:hypothetical protein
MILPDAAVSAFLNAEIPQDAPYALAVLTGLEAAAPYIAAQALLEAAAAIDEIDTDRRGEPYGEGYIEGLRRASDELSNRADELDPRGE